MIAINHTAKLSDPSIAECSRIAVDLDVDLRSGLTQVEAKRRLGLYGANELRGARRMPRWRRVLAQFQDPLIYLLLAAICIAIVAWFIEGRAGWPLDACVIAVVVLLNGVVGYVQEAKAENAVAALAKMTTVTAAVLRDGRQTRVSSAELVRGDVLVLAEGDAVGADARLFKAASLKVQEASLTGESESVLKDASTLLAPSALGDRFNMVFKGTAVAQGTASAIVTATGMATEMGHIAHLLDSTKASRQTPLQLEVGRVGRMLGLAVVVIAIMVVTTILLLSDIRTAGDVIPVLLLGVSLAVAAVPEGLPAILSLVLALGVQRMAKHRAIVKSLSSVETLGCASVIASDKTGTLTRAEMTIQRVITVSGGTWITGVGYSPEGRVEVDGFELPAGSLREEQILTLGGGSLSGNAVLSQNGSVWSIQGDPTDAAFLVAERKLGVAERRMNRYRRIAEIPFTSERKLASTLEIDRENGARVVLFTKGAPGILLERCSLARRGLEIVELDTALRERLLEDIDKLADAALRTLAVAYRPLDGNEDFAAGEALERGLIFAGVVGMIDPPREEAADAIRSAQLAGIRVLMITGDHPRTASRIARDLGIVGNDAAVLVGTEIEAMDDARFAQAVRVTSVFARVAPAHKLRIVKALQADGEVVAMTGDGVNDAPALKAADIGIAMGMTGAEVTKEASKMILADDNFATIVNAIREGRSVFDNIRKFLRFLLSSNLGEVLTVFLGVVGAGVFGISSGTGAVTLPILATQLLWINLVTDSGPALALGVDPPVGDMMAKRPRRSSDRLIDTRMWLDMAEVGVVVAASSLLTIDLYLPGGLIDGNESLSSARTAGFTVLVLANLLVALISRSDTASACVNLFANRWLWGAIVVSTMLQIAVVHITFLNLAFGTVPLSLSQWLVCVAMASMVLWFNEIRKWITRRRYRLRTRSSQGKSANVFSRRSIAFVFMLFMPGFAVAQQTLTWDVNGPQTAVGGSGAWNTTSNFWQHGTTYQPWSNAAPDNAVFAGSAGTVSLTGTIAAHALVFNVGGYTLTGGALTLGGSSAGITTQVAVTTVNSALLGSSGFVKDGNATLALGGISTGFTGVVHLNAGTLRVDSPNALGLSTSASNLIFASGSTFSFNTNFSHDYTLTGGTVNIQGGAFTWSGSPTLSAATTLNLNSRVAGGTLSGNLVNTSANILSVTRNGPGRIQLTGTNSYTGATTITAGHLQIGSSGALSVGSNVVFNGTAGMGGDLELTAGSGNFSRELGTSANQVQWTGDGGFVSSGAARTVNLGGLGSQLIWGAGAFVPSGSRLVLGTTSNHMLDFQNAIDAGGEIRAVQGDGGTLSGHARISGIVSGSGGLNQVGNGILELTAINTYSGGTLLSSGTLLVSNDANLGAASGKLEFNGGTLRTEGGFSTSRSVAVDAGGGTLQTDANLVQSGGVTGTGRLTKSGASILTLLGSDSHTGGTTISAGTLQIGNGGASGTLNGSVIDNAALVFYRSDVTVFSGSVSGSGTVEQRGTGTLILGGENSFAGGTLISAGTLQIGNGAGGGSLVGNVADNGALVFDRADLTSFGGIVSGSGSLTKAGVGSLDLSGPSVYSGGTFIDAGTLRLSGSATLGATSGITTINSGSLDLGGTSQTQSQVIQAAGEVTNGRITVSNYLLLGGNVARSATISANGGFDLRSGSVQGVLTGTAALFKNSSGSVTLAGHNTYAGGTVINAGTLFIGDGVSVGSFKGNVVADGVLAFNLPKDSLFEGVISGNGEVQQRGPGKLTLNGNSSSFNGKTSVAGGTLEVDGAIGGATHVIGGGRLAGNGSIGATRIEAGGTLAPGSPFGQLTIAGNAIFSAGSTLEVKTDSAGGMTKLQVAGVAEIEGGSVNVVTQGSVFRTGARYTIVSADAGRVGQFAALTETLPLLDLTLAYGPGAVYVDVARSSATLCSLRVSRNQCETSTTGPSLGDNNPVSIAVLNLPNLPSIQAALDGLSGEVHGAINAELLESGRYVRDAVLQGMQSQNSASDTTGLKAWGTFINKHSRASGDGNAAASNNNTSGFLVGAMPWTIGPVQWGAAAGFTKTSLEVNARNSFASGDSLHAALYGMMTTSGTDLRAGVATSLHRVRTHREVSFAGFSDSNDAVRNANTTQIFAEAAYPLSAGSLGFEPYVELAHVRLTSNRFSEDGGPAALRAEKAEQSISYSTFGVNLKQDFSPFGVLGVARLKVGWRQARGALAASSEQSIGTSAPYTASGVPIAKNTVVISWGIEVAISRSLRAAVTYSGQFARAKQENGLQADLAWAF